MSDDSAPHEPKPSASPPENLPEKLPENLAESSEQDGRPRLGSASMTLFALLICAAIFRIGYGILVQHELSQGIAMFIGLPVILGTVVAFATFPRSPLGMVFKVTTLVLCVLAPLAAEGAICIVMAAPLIFAMIGLGALIVHLLSPKVGRGKASCCALLLGVLPLAWEPAHKAPGWESLRPVEEVADSIDLDASPARAWQALSEGSIDPQTAPLPMFMRLRLQPGERKVTGRGLTPGATRDIFFDQDHFIGQVVRSVPEREAVFAVRETAAGPGERIALWLRFVEVRFNLVDLGQGRTRLTQVTRYRRLLDPGLYFGPLERQGVHAMHRYTLALYRHSLQQTAARHD